ncbi:hypothetical protein CAPTEDRAFT_214461 [Capitella teleta]|uniref:Uncharacterized protein n=1 Tax=Capitella teleta TaxID=283909 RepID=R7US36_CAPTE|nr:hypothetical protein CAPTEDRAFT_214461 [Capitella teleta]|eukprot:ELU09010.1 hypothetical protein CAPTEDRAFT_214461 [Capitella teleta]
MSRLLQTPRSIYPPEKPRGDKWREECENRYNQERKALQELEICADTLAWQDFDEERDALWETYYYNTKTPYKFTYANGEQSVHPTIVFVGARDFANIRYHKDLSRSDPLLTPCEYKRCHKTPGVASNPKTLYHIMGKRAGHIHSEHVFISVLKGPQKLKTFFSKRHDDSENSVAWYKTIARYYQTFKRLCDVSGAQVGEGVKVVVQETTGPGCFADPIFEALDESDRDAGVTLETPKERADRRRDLAFDPHFRWCENYDLKDTLAMCQAVQLGNPYDSDSNCGHCANQDTNYPMLRLNILEVDAKEYWQREAEAKRGLHLDKMRLAAELEAQRESLRAREEAKVPPTIPPVRKESLPAEVHITCTEKVAGCGKSAFTCTARDEEGVVLHTFTFDY